MSQKTLIQVRVDESQKKQADMLFADLGFDTPTAIRIFLKKALEYEGMPFDVARPKPNAETLAAMLDSAEMHPKTYNSFSEILEEIDEELEAVPERDPTIKKAVLKRMELSDDERARMLADKREMERMDKQVAERRARKQGAIEIAKNLIKAGYTVDKIVLVTGLTREEVEGLTSVE